MRKFGDSSSFGSRFNPDILVADIAEAHLARPTDVERHGTELAGVLVGCAATGRPTVDDRTQDVGVEDDVDVVPIIGFEGRGQRAASPAATSASGAPTAASRRGGSGFRRRRREPHHATAGTQPLARELASVGVERHGVAGNVVLDERCENTLETAVRGLFRSQQNASPTTARAPDLEAELDILQRLVEHQPATFRGLGRSDEDAVNRLPVGLPEPMPAVERRPLESPVGYEAAARGHHGRQREAGRYRGGDTESAEHGCLHPGLRPGP